VQVFIDLVKPSVVGFTQMALLHIKPAPWGLGFNFKTKGNLAINPQEELAKFSYATLGNHPQEKLAKFR
jgi:hypothetical protein